MHRNEPAIFCEFCNEPFYFTGHDGQPAGCVGCGAGPCGRCGDLREGDEVICAECAKALDELSQREHERDHAAGAL